MAIEKEFKIALVIILAICVACITCFTVSAIVTNTPAYKANMAAKEAARNEKEEEKRLRKAAEETERKITEVEERLRKDGEETARKEAEEEKRLREEEAKYKFSVNGTYQRKFEAALVKDDPGRHKDVRALSFNDEGQLEIQYEQRTGFPSNRKAILVEAKEWCKFIYEEHDFPFVNEVVLLPVAETKDRYGRERESTVARISLGKEVGRKIVYNNITTDEFCEILLLDGEFRPLVKF